MAAEPLYLRDSFVHRLDPRLRILAALGFSILAVSSTRFGVLGAELAASIALVVAARVPALVVLRQFALLNAFVLLLIAVLPFTTPGVPVVYAGPLAVSHEGLILSCAIALKSNAIAWALMALIGTMEAATLGHALQHLRVPEKLIHLFLFTVRYIDVFRGEHQRLARAMKVRGFRPSVNVHALESLGYLVGMMLVRSLDRSERILAAMKCRGFRGRFFLLDHFAFTHRDLAFAAGFAATCAALIWMEWA